MAVQQAELELVASLVEGVFETPLWSSFLEQLRRATGAEYAILNFRPPGRPFSEEVLLLSGAETPGLDDIKAGKFPPGDPPVDERMIEGRPYSLDDMRGPGGPPQFRAYLDFLAQAGVTAVRQMRVQDVSGVHGWLTIARRGEDFSPDVSGLMSSIARVLRAALRHYVALERERFEGSLAAEAVRRLQFGWFTLDAAGSVLDCDEQAANALAHSKVLRVASNGRLIASSTRLEREILQAADRLARNPQSRPHPITLSQDPWVDMLLLPARRKSISAKAAPAVIAYVHGDNWGSAERGDQLAELFRLSPREAQVTLALCRGMTIAEAAAEFGLSVGTTRNHSKAIYAKTGARGLPDLVRIVMRSVLAIAPDA